MTLDRLCQGLTVLNHRQVLAERRGGQPGLSLGELCFALLDPGADLAKSPVDRFAGPGPVGKPVEPPFQRQTDR